MSSPSRHLPPVRRRFVAAVCAVSVWLLGVFAASPHLHGALHAEAGHATHSCAITLFAEGFEHPVSTATLSLAPVWFESGERRSAVTAPAQAIGDWLPPGRGPPAC